MAAEMEDPTGKRSESSREAPRARSPGRGPAPSMGAGLVAFTIDTDSGGLVKVEAVDEGGGRRELKIEELTTLADANRQTLHDIIEKTFEAGIASVLDERAEESFQDESAEDAELRRLILRPLIEKSAVRHLMRREALGRAILATLIQDTAALLDLEPEEAAPAPRRARPSAGGHGAPRGRARH